MEISRRQWNKLDTEEKAKFTKTNPNEARFWSGRSYSKNGNEYSGDENSKHLAKNDIGKTLEMKLDENNIDKDNISPKDWQEASKNFAEGALGDIKCCKGDELHKNNIYENTEKFIIENNKNIDSIIEVDNITGKNVKACYIRNLKTGNLEDINGNKFIS